MIVEKQATASLSHGVSQVVNFIIQNCIGTSQKRNYRVSLSVHNHTSSKIRLSDGNGRLLLEESKIPSHTYVIKNLEVGTYFFEVNDGFYYQIKELKILA